MKSKIFVNLIFTLFVMNYFAFAQKKTCGIQNVYAFYTESIAGNIAVNSNGKPLKSGVSIWYTFYVETMINKLFKFDSVKIEGMTYGISLSSNPTNFPVNAGKLKNTPKSYWITPKKGNQLFKIEVQFSKPIKDTATTLSPIVLEGKCRNHKIVYVVNNILKLQAPLYP